MSKPENRNQNRSKRELPDAAKPYQFKPGQSGNPGGRPKKKPITEIYEELFSDPQLREAIKAQILRTMTTKGMAGVLERSRAAERLEGKVTDSLSVNLKSKVTLEQVLESERRVGK